MMSKEHIILCEQLFVSPCHDSGLMLTYKGISHLLPVCHFAAHYVRAMLLGAVVLY